MILESLMYTCRMAGFLPVTRVSTRSKLSNAMEIEIHSKYSFIHCSEIFEYIHVFFFFFFDKMYFNYNTVYKRICSYIVNNVTSAKLINNNAEKALFFFFNYIFSGVFIIYMPCIL